MVTVQAGAWHGGLSLLERFQQAGYGSDHMTGPSTEKERVPVLIHLLASVPWKAGVLLGTHISGKHSSTTRNERVHIRADTASTMAWMWMIAPRRLVMASSCC